MTLYNHNSNEKLVRFKCDICLKEFAQKVFLIKHIKTHTGEKPYQCTICLKSFSQRAVLETHKKIHSGEKIFKCNYCLKVFAHKYILVRHERYHTSDMLYRCDICLHSFARNSDLVSHKTTQTGLKSNKKNVNLPSRIGVNSHFIGVLPLATCPGTSNSYIKRRRCIVCASSKKRTNTKFFCKQCVVPLCEEPCFEIYHTKVNF